MLDDDFCATKRSSDLKPDVDQVNVDNEHHKKVHEGRDKSEGRREARAAECESGADTKEMQNERRASRQS